MRTVIAGSRDITDNHLIEDVLENHVPWTPSVVLSGAARGVDTMGELWARKNKIPTERYIPEWDRLGKSAGYVRNKEMAEAGEALVALWDGRSKGTKHMIDLALARGLKIFVWRTDISRGFLL